MTSPAPLAGIRVIDLTHLIAGPFCTMLLADAGAEVIKVEPPTGDISRRRIPARSDNGLPDESGYFVAVNRGKKSVTLDLKAPQGLAVLQDLLAAADVLVENYRPGVLDRLGVDIDEICRQHPRLVVASITAFGKRGLPPHLQEVPGLAIVAEAMSGITGRTKSEHGWPVWCGFPLGDFTAGLTAQAAILTALLARERTGRGAQLDISMADSMLAFNASSLASDTFPQPDGRSAPLPTVPYGVFRCRDGHVAIGVNSDVFWQRLCAAMERDDLAVDAVLATQEGRGEHADEVKALVDQWTLHLCRDHVVTLLQQHGVPVSPVNQTADVMGSDLFRQRQMLLSASGHPGDLPVIPGSAQGHDVNGRWSPRLGEHTASVLREVLHLDDERIRSLKSVGAFGAD